MRAKARREVKVYKYMRELVLFRLKLRENLSRYMRQEENSPPFMSL